MKTHLHLRTFLKPILYTVVMLVCVAVVAPACEQGGPRGMGHGEKAAKLKEALGLTDEQSAQIKTIMGDARTQVKALREQAKADGAASREDTKAAAKEIRSDARAKVEALLTGSQLALFEEFTKEQKAKRQERRQQRRRGNEA